MHGIFGQVIAVTRVNIKGLPGRSGLVVATGICVALVVATLLGLDALNQGLKKTLEQSGARDIAIIMRGGTQAEINSVVTGDQLDILSTLPNVGALSPEVNLIVDGFRISDGQRANISLRGLTSAGISLRSNVSLVNGRWPEVGVSELVVGKSIADTYRGMTIGSTILMGTASWNIVGIFEANGSISESEIWADLGAVQNLFNRSNQFQSVRTRLQRVTAIKTLTDFSERDPRLQLAVVSEADYYAGQAARTSELAQKLAWPLATLMAIGAVVGALNTMQAAFATRMSEIATLRAVGFLRSSIFLGLLIESIVICFVAGLVGALAAYLILDGLTASTLGGGITRIGYALKFTLSGFWQGIGLAVGIGILGASLPASLASFRSVAKTAR